MVKMAVMVVVKGDVFFDALDVDESGFVSIEEILLLGNVVDAPFVLWSPTQFREAGGTADAVGLQKSFFRGGLRRASTSPVRRTAAAS